MITQLQVHGVLPADLAASLVAEANRLRESMQPPIPETKPEDVYDSSEEELQTTTEPAESDKRLSTSDRKHVRHSTDGTIDSRPDSIDGLSSLPRDPISMSTLSKFSASLNDPTGQADPRFTLLTHLFLVCIADGRYSSFARSLLRTVAEVLELSVHECIFIERLIVEEVRMSEEERVAKDGRSVEKQSKRERRRKWALMGLATVGGGLVIGLTAGLAAPFIGAGVATALGAVGVSGTGAFLTSAGGIAMITTGGVLTGSGLSGYHMSRRTADIEEFEFMENPPGPGEEKFFPEDDPRRIAWEEKQKLKAEAEAKKKAELEEKTKASLDGKPTSPKSVDVKSEEEGKTIASPKSPTSTTGPIKSPGAQSIRLEDSMNRVSLESTTSVNSEARVAMERATKMRPPNVIVSISGWLVNGNEDFWLPYRLVSFFLITHILFSFYILTLMNFFVISVLPTSYGDHYSLVWESKALKELGSALKIFASELVSFGVSQILQATVLPVLMAGLTGPLWAMKLSYFVDNPWGVGLTKARKAGEILADTLVNNTQSSRPVTLIGYSLGARVVFYCLLELANRKCFGIVEEAYLFGTPVTASKSEWDSIASAVSGRVVNGYTVNDWVLGVVYRTGNWGSVAGLSQVLDVAGVENVDLTHLVNGHLQYRLAMPRILKHCGFQVTQEKLQEELDMEAAEEEKRLKALAATVAATSEKRKSISHNDDDGGESLEYRMVTQTRLTAEEQEAIDRINASEMDRISDTELEELGGKKMEKKNLPSSAPSSTFGSSNSLSSVANGSSSTNAGKKRSWFSWGRKQSSEGDLITLADEQSQLQQRQPEFIPKEIKSTLPAFVLSPKTEPTVIENGALTPREIKSTLPPLVLEIRGDSLPQPQKISPEQEQYVNDNVASFQFNMEHNGTQPIPTRRHSDIVVGGRPLFREEELDPEILSPYSEADVMDLRLQNAVVERSLTSLQVNNPWGDVEKKQQQQ